MVLLVAGMESEELESERVKMESRGNDKSKICGAQEKCEMNIENL